MDLTKRQQEIFDFIRKYSAKYGYPPTVRDIGKAVGLASSSTVHAHLANLEKIGLLRRDPSKPRAIELLDRAGGSAVESMKGIVRPEGLPLLGSVAAGQPVLAEENIEEYVSIPEIAGGEEGENPLRIRRPWGKGRTRKGEVAERSPRGNPRESATETNRLRPPSHVNGGPARVKWCGKSAPAPRRRGGWANPTRCKAKQDRSQAARRGPGRPLRWMAAQRQNPAYRPAKEKPRSGGAFLLTGPPGPRLDGPGSTGRHA